MKKWIKYATLVQSQIGAMFEEESENYIDISEFTDGENIKQFIHAISTVVPASIFEKLTGEQKNHLEFNHVANGLCFEYCEKGNSTE